MMLLFFQESRLGGEKPPPESLNLAAAAGLPFFPGLGAGGFFQRGAPPTDFQVRHSTVDSILASRPVAPGSILSVPKIFLEFLDIAEIYRQQCTA